MYGMFMAQKPTFCIVLGDGDNWSVEAEWPDGTIEKVDSFKRHFEAVNWLRTRSEAWWMERSMQFASPQLT